MTRRIRRSLVVVAAGVALTVTAACSNPDAGGQDPTGGAADSLVVGIATEPDTLSPLLGYGKDGNSKIFDGLLRRDAHFNLEPALATALPDISADGLTYTYTVRKGVTFSDGEPFGADDVVYTYRTLLDPGTNNPNRTELDALKSVRADGDRVVFTLRYPYAAFAGRTVLPIVPEHVLAEQDVNTGSFTTEPIGTGPYLLADWRRGEKLTLKANPHYWDGAPQVTSLTFAVVKDDDVRATRLRSGDLDAAVLPPNLAAAFKDTDGKKTLTATSADYRGVTLPSGNAVTGDPAVRRALDVAVDRDSMVRDVLDGAGRAAHSPLPTTSPYFARGTERDHDPEAAREILDRAGWKTDDDGGVRAKNGTRASFTLWYPSGDKLRQDHALAFASDARKVGIDVRVQAGTWETIEPRLPEDAVLQGGGNPADPDYDLYGLLHSSLAGDGFNNMSHYRNGAVDRYLTQARRTQDDGERRRAYADLQRELVRDPAGVFLTHVDHIYVMDDDWTGVTTQPEPHDHGLGAGPWWNVEDWRPRR